jgi:hypothetical protein
MAERPFDKQNWQGRSVTSFGPKFRLDMNNPQMGLNGTDVYNLYAVTDNNDVCLTGLTEGGTYRIYNDRSIEIIAGQKSESNGVDIIISGRNGDVCITAEKNGRVRIRAQNIMIDADEDVDIKAGRNITLDAGSGRVLLKGNKLDASGLTGNLVPEGTSFGEQVFAGVAGNVGIDVIKAKFSGPASGITSLIGL